MKRIRLIYLSSIVLIAVLLLNSFKPFSKHFQLSKLPSALMLPQTVQYKDKFLIISQGVTDSFRKKMNFHLSFQTDTLNAIYEFNAATGAVKKIADAGFTRYFFSAAMLGSKLYIAGGYNSANKPTSTMYVYDFDTKNWDEANSMFIERTRFALASVKNKLYAIGGETTNGSIEVYDPKNDLWELVNVRFIPANAKPLLTISTSSVIDEKIFLLGTDGTQFQEYDPMESLQKEGPDAPLKTDLYSSVVLDRRIYFAAGLNNTVIDDRAYVYNVNEGSWSVAGQIPVPRYGSGLAFFDGMLFYLGGSTNNPVKKGEPTNEIYMFKPVIQ